MTPIAAAGMPNVQCSGWSGVLASGRGGRHAGVNQADQAQGFAVEGLA